MAAEPESTPGRPAFRRTLFYVAGFDPERPSKYHALYREHAPPAAALSGAGVEVGALDRKSKLTQTWRVVWTGADGARTETEHVFLYWSDVVRAVWAPYGIGFLFAIWRALAVCYASGLMRRLAREKSTFYFTMLLPAAISTLYLALFALAIFGLGAAAAHLTRGLDWPWKLLAALPLLLVFTIVPIWRRIDERVHVAWLARCVMAVVRPPQNVVAKYQDRAHAFGDLIVQAAASDVDEVLVVGHSIGAQIAAQALGHASRALSDEAKVSLLTLGSAIPVYAMTAPDPVFRRDLAALEAATAIPWLDISSPGDAACSARLHPLAGAGLAEGERPARRSPRFHAVLSPARWRAVRRNALDLHFQYLKSHDRSGGFDFFQLTAGPGRLSTKLNAAWPGGAA